MTTQDKKHLAELIHSARIVVRETGKAAEQAEQQLPFSSNLRIAVLMAYDMACAHFTQLDPARAAEFIRSTYGPAFRQTGVTK